MLNVYTRAVLRFYLRVATMVATIVFAALLLANFLEWTLDRKYQPPIGCGGCTYAEHLRATAREIADIARHLW